VSSGVGQAHWQAGSRVETLEGKMLSYAMPSEKLSPYFVMYESSVAGSLMRDKAWYQREKH